MTTLPTVQELRLLRHLRVVHAVLDRCRKQLDSMNDDHASILLDVERVFAPCQHEGCPGLLEPDVLEAMEVEYYDYFSQMARWEEVP